LAPAPEKHCKTILKRVHKEPWRKSKPFQHSVVSATVVVAMAAKVLTPEEQKQLDDQLVQATLKADMAAVHEYILKGADYQASFRKSLELKQQIATPALNMNMFQKPSEADGAPAAVELSAVKVDVPPKQAEKAPLTAHAEESKVTCRPPWVVPGTRPHFLSCRHSGHHDRIVITIYHINAMTHVSHFKFFQFCVSGA
jgi:hypothetical protein